MKKNNKTGDKVLFILLVILSIAFLIPIFFILLNSFKGKLYISDAPFALPTSETFSGLTNYINGIKKTNFLSAFGCSLFITLGSVGMILLLTSMAAYYLTRVKSRLTSMLYYLFVFSMIVPFQMVMFTMTKLADMCHLNNPVGMIVLYVGFGAGLSVFMFCGFIKSIPLEIEEAAMIDGCTPIQTFFNIVMPILKPTAITVAILNAMWIWNDYLLPSLTLKSKMNRTIPISTAKFFGQYTISWNEAMAALVVTIIPVALFYLSCQKYIVKGVAAGAVKG